MAHGPSATPLAPWRREIAFRLAIAGMAAAGFVFVAWQAAQPHLVSRTIYTMRAPDPPILNVAGDDFADPVLLRAELFAADLWAEANPSAKPRDCPEGMPSYRQACADMLRSFAVAGRTRPRSPPLGSHVRTPAPEGFGVHRAVGGG